jgi:hypothetical protein
VPSARRASGSMSWPWCRFGSCNRGNAVAELAHPSAKTGPCLPAVACACEGAGLPGVQGTPTPPRRVWASHRGGASRAVLSRPSSRGRFSAGVCARESQPAAPQHALALTSPWSCPARRRRAARPPRSQGFSSNTWWATGSVGLKEVVGRRPDLGPKPSWLLAGRRPSAG